MSGTRPAGMEQTAMPPRGMCIGLPATQGVLRPSANPPLQGLVRSALGKRGKPVRRYVDFQPERSVRGFSRSHMLFAAWGMTATRLGSKWDNSKIHPKGTSSFAHNLKWDNSEIHPKGICLFVYHLKNLCFFQVLLNNYCIALFLVEPPTSSWLQQALPMCVGEEVQPGKLMGESAHPGTSPGGVRGCVCGGGFRPVFPFS